jgi:hypothetical protein
VTDNSPVPELYGTPRLGIDIGNVIMAGDNDALFGSGPMGAGYSEEAMLAMPEVDGAIEAVGRLVQLFGEQNVWLISKASRNTEAKTHRWLLYNSIYSRTGLLETHAWFCRARPDKAVICEFLGIGWFVDDRPDVLYPMDGLVPHRYLLGNQWLVSPRGITAVADWPAAEKAIREDFPVAG